MKKVVITLSLLAGATAAYSQGQINWSDYQAAQSTPPLPAFLITVWAPGSFTPGTGSPGSATYANTANDLPSGSAMYGGAPLGAGYEIGLYTGLTAAAVQSAITGGTAIATAPFETGANAGGWDFTGSLTATDPNNASGAAVFVGLAAWSTADSASTYAQAKSQGVATGFEVSTGTTTEGGGGTPPATPGTLAGIGLTDFAVTTSVPEPSTIALGVIGASTFLMRLRRKV